MKNLLSLLAGLIIGAALAYVFIDRDMTMTDAQITPPKGLISPAEAKTLDQAFNLKHRIINDSLFKTSTDGGDNRSSWFALSEVEAYLAYAKQQTSDLGFTMDGLRIYLGSYPDSKASTGLTTMFLVPTGTKNTSQGAFFSLPQGGSPDIDGGDALNKSSNGMPPSANYPQ